MNGKSAAKDPHKMITFETLNKQNRNSRDEISKENLTLCSAFSLCAAVARLGRHWQPARHIKLECESNKKAAKTNIGCDSANDDSRFRIIHASPNVDRESGSSSDAACGRPPTKSNQIDGESHDQ